MTSCVMGDPSVSITCSETLLVLIHLLFSINYTDYIRLLSSMLSHLLTGITWPFYFRETVKVKVTVRIYCKEKLLIRGKAAYPSVMRIPQARNRGNFHPCWKKQLWQQPLPYCLDPWNDAYFWNDNSSWIMLLILLSILENWWSRFPGKWKGSTGVLLYFELFVDISVFLISTLLRMRAFYLMYFYCRIIRIPHSDWTCVYYFSQGNCDRVLKNFLMIFVFVNSVNIW